MFDINNILISIYINSRLVLKALMTGAVWWAFAKLNLSNTWQWQCHGRCMIYTAYDGKTHAGLLSSLHVHLQSAHTRSYIMLLGYWWALHMQCTLNPPCSAHNVHLVCCSELFPCASQELQSPLCPLTIIVNPTKDAAGRCAAYQWPVKTWGVPPLRGLVLPSLMHYFSLSCDLSLPPSKLISSVKLRFFWEEGAIKSGLFGCSFQIALACQVTSGKEFMRKHIYCLGALCFKLRWKLTCLWTRLWQKMATRVVKHGETC